MNDTELFNLTMIVIACLAIPVAGVFLFMWRRSQRDPRLLIAADERIEPTLATKPIAPKVPPELVGEVVRTVEDFPALPDTMNDDVHYIVRIWQQTAPRPMDEAAFAGLVENLEAHSLERLYSMAAYDAENGKWESPRLDKPYGCYLWGTALANRGGKLASENVAAIKAYATRFAADNDMFVSTPKDSDVLQVIDLLDKFCAEVDQKATVYLANMPGGRAAANMVQSVNELALAEGFVVDRSGDVAYYEDNERLFILRARNGGRLGEEPPSRILSGLKLEMDIPQLSDPAGAFDAMVACARNLAKSLHFSVVNDRTVPITDGDFGEYRRHIVGIRERMDSYGVMAGSTIARTLFS